MTDIIVVVVILIILSLAVGYIIYSKKKGVKCIGCPSGGNCKECTSNCPSKDN